MPDCGRCHNPLREAIDNEHFVCLLCALVYCNHGKECPVGTSYKHADLIKELHPKEYTRA